MLSPLDNDLMLPSLVDAQITYVWQRTEQVGGEAQDVQANQS